jgi:hypothetical protein
MKLAELLTLIGKWFKKNPKVVEAAVEVAKNSIPDKTKETIKKIDDAIDPLIAIADVVAPGNTVNALKDVSKKVDEVVD